MSLSDAKRLLQWKVITEALTEAGVDAELVAMVEHARSVDETVNSMARVLLGGADTTRARNYVKVDMVGMLPPFERAYVELIRPGGRTSHELRELLRDRLTHVRRLLADGCPPKALRQDMLDEIDETLAVEAP